MKLIPPLVIVAFAVPLAIFASNHLRSDGPVTNGPTSATDVAGASPWMNPTDALTLNGICTVADAKTATDQLWLEGFGFAIPTGRTITGIAVNFVGRDTATVAIAPPNGQTIELISGGSLSGATHTSNGQMFGGVAKLITKTIGADGDLWGATWTPAQINAANLLRLCLPEPPTPTNRALPLGKFKMRAIRAI